MIYGAITRLYRKSRCAARAASDINHVSELMPPPHRGGGINSQTLRYDLRHCRSVSRLLIKGE